MAKPDDEKSQTNLADSAQKIPSPHADALRGGPSLPGTPLAALDGRSIAVEISFGGQDRVLVGTAVYGTDEELGNVLRIVVAGEMELEFVLAESVWSGQILTGQKHGTDYLVCLNAQAAVAPATNQPAQ